MSRSLVHPEQVERRLIDLSREVDEAHDECVQAERSYFDAKAKYEIGIARARIDVAKRFAARGEKATVQEKEDAALIEAHVLLTNLYLAEAVVRAARGNVARVRTQTDLARSVSANVRSALDLT
jgi:hypothetical protein